MKIFLTGACGYKGSVLVPKLLKAGHQVVAFDIMWFGNFLEPHPDLTVVQGDVRNSNEIDLTGIEAIIHLSSVANDPCGDLDPKLTWEISCLATMQLADKVFVRHFRRNAQADKETCDKLESVEGSTRSLSVHIGSSGVGDFGMTWPATGLATICFLLCTRLRNAFTTYSIAVLLFSE